MIVIGIAILALAGMLLALAILVRRSVSAPGGLPLDAGWIDELSVERYRPMMRLLDDRDLEFLRSQPGFTPRMATRLRIQRCQIFRGYLHCLEGDFQRVCMAVKALMLQSRRDRPDLAAALVRHQATFVLTLAMVNVRVFFYRWGWGGVDVSALVRSFDAMRLELRSLAPSAAGATV
ncbi:MAG: hypothetical protein ABSC23_14795 [Bryobacteraceae bacterium]|jgi:hypothetical protein